MVDDNVKSLERALNILDGFLALGQELSIRELYEYTGINKTTLVRILQTLITFDLVRQDPVSRNYRLGFKSLYLSSLFLRDIDVRREALPFMKTLTNNLNETVNLSISDGGERVCIEVIEATQDVRHFVRLGQRSELYRGSTGKVLLAFLPESESESALLKAKNEGINMVALQAALERIRLDGYALTREERLPGSFAISSPIFNSQGKLSACITVSGPIQRLDESRIPLMVSETISAAKGISQHMGYSNDMNAGLHMNGEFNQN